MNRVKLWLTIAAVAFMVGACSQVLIEKASAQTFGSQKAKSEKAIRNFYRATKTGVVIVMFYSKKIAKSMRTLKLVKQYQKDNPHMLKIIKIEVEKNPAIIDVFEIKRQHIPVVMIFRNGDVVGAALGEPSQQQFDSLITKCLQMKITDEINAREQNQELTEQ